MNKIRFLTFAVSLFFSASINAQINQEGKKVYTLKEMINIARQQSIQSKVAETIRENRFWQFQTYRSNYKPQLAADGVIPAYTRAFRPITQNDGTIDFLPVQNNNSELNLNITQPLHWTGAEVFVNSNLNRFDNFLDDADLGYEKYHQWSGTPLEIGLRQPLFQYNELKWDRRIEPLRYEESQREYFEGLEEISLNTTRRFFDLMLAQIELQIALKNVANNDTIFKIAQGRYNLGKIAENELLQLEQDLMTSRLQMAQAKLDIENSTYRLKTYVGLPEAEELTLVLPDEIPDFEVDDELALTFAKANRAEAISFDRRILEAEAAVARAKGGTGPQADLFATFGLTNRSIENGEASEIYEDPRDQQFVRLGFQIPILDWGRRKSRVKTAEANQKMTQFIVDQDIVSFDEEVLTAVRQIEMLKDKIKITKVADDVAQRRYDITRNRFDIGKITITDMGLALTAKDGAKQDYIQSLRDYWQAYFNLRMLTLYDFESGFQILSDEL